MPQAPELSAFMFSAQPRTFPISQDHHQRLTHVAFAHPIQTDSQCDTLHETHVVTTRWCENKQSTCWQSHFQTTGNGFQAGFTATIQHLGNKPQMRKTNWNRTMRRTSWTRPLTNCSIFGNNEINLTIHQPGDSQDINYFSPTCPLSPHM